jgi:hypothetical protein
MSDDEDRTLDVAEFRARHAANLKRQLERTRGTYLMMRESGYSKDKSVRLRFAYRAAPKEAADALADHLRSRTRYVVQIDAEGDRWIVHGVTKPARLSASSLGRWVHWMYTAGYKFDCVFDGWGARVSG